MINFTWFSQRLTDMRDRVRADWQAMPSFRDLTSFAWLAKISTGRKPRFYGLLPPVGTILTVLIMSCLIASGLWAWSSIISQASAGVISFLPFLEEALLGVMGLAVLNFWFNREINTFMLSSREVLDNFTFMENENPTDLRKMVEHLRQELNEHFRDFYKEKHQDLPMPQICTFTQTDFQIITVEGRNPGKAAIFISSGALNYSLTKMNQRHLAALIQMELVKIYLRRGVTRTIAGMGADLLTNLKTFFKDSVLGVFTFLNFFVFLERSIKRSYEYEAAEVVIQCGRGVDLVEAIDKKVCASLDTKPTYKEARDQQNANKRNPHTGYFQSIANWIDNNEPTTVDKTGYRILSFFETLVREIGYYIRELWAPNPRSTRLKEHIKKNIVGTPTATNAAPTLDNVTTAEMNILDQYARMNINDQLYQLIPVNSRYDVIGPNGNGEKKPTAPSRINKLKAKVKTLKTRLARLEAIFSSNNNQGKEQEIQPQIMEFQEAVSHAFDAFLATTPQTAANEDQPQQTDSVSKDDSVSPQSRKRMGE